MWDPYVNSVHEHLPESANKIVFDKYHIARHWVKPSIEYDGGSRRD